MIVGDLFSRFAWVGVFFGMMFIGALFRYMDSKLAVFGVRQALLFSLLLPMVSKLPQYSLFEYFMFFTRNLFILYVVSRVLERFLAPPRRPRRLYGAQYAEYQGEPAQTLSRSHPSR